MANKSLLTDGAKTSLTQLSYYSPVLVVNGHPAVSMFSFLAHVGSWANDNDPPAPTKDVKSLKSLMKGIFVVKKINSNEFSPVIQRTDWTSGITYNYYQDDVDMLQRDINGSLIKTFYVKNRYDQVFKCLSNNFVDGVHVASTIEPYFEPGSYDTNKIFHGSDGYKWKYIYTVDIAAKIKFMDSTWLPVPVGTAPDPLLNSTAGYGNIDVINVISSGFGYDQANAAITVSVKGDGTGCTATANVKNGGIDFITVNSAGKNFTYSTVTITSASGSGCIATAPTSPIGGHGSDPITELGCAHIMITSTFTGAEKDASGTDMIPTDIDFHQIGLLVNPVALSSFPLAANKTIYKTSTDLVVAGGFGIFVPDEIVYYGASLEDAYLNGFVGTVLSFDPAANILKLINCVGTLTTNAPIFGDTSKTVRTLLAYSLPDFEPLSGNIAYIENRSSVQRSTDGIEQMKVVFGF